MKKILVLLMCLTAAFTVVHSEERIMSLSEVPLADCEEDLARLGIVAGRPEGFALEENLTRAEAVTLAERTIRPKYLNGANDGFKFTDIHGHWAESTIARMKFSGMVSGINKNEFAPERNVTGAEFTVILLRSMGYKDATTENALEKGKEYRLLENNFTKSIAACTEPIRRSDAFRLCCAALTADMPGGGMLYETLISKGYYDENAFEGFLYVSCNVEPDFADNLNALMPKDSNYMFSPLSIRMALAMAANGAEGETQSEILSAVGIEHLDEYNENAAQLIEKYRKSGVLKLDIANSLWVNTDHALVSFSAPFKELAEKYYDAKADTVNDENSMQVVNGWVKEKTHDKIDSILDKPQFENLLLNAVYFKGFWQNPFESHNTGKEDFTDFENNVAGIDFMHRTGTISYYACADSEVVRLPYRNYEIVDGERVKHDDINVAMYVIKGSAAKNPVAFLDSGIELKPTYISLALPKFESMYGDELNDELQSLGMIRAFKPETADFSPMISRPIEFYIQSVMHKTYIKVDEEGTEAAAVTGVFAVGTGIDTRVPIVVKFNSPFTYVIKDDANGEILFVGTKVK